MIFSLSPADSAINQTIHLPGSKSETNRALILSALADSKITLRGASQSEDSTAVISALKKLGVKFEIAGSSLIIEPPRSGLQPFSGQVDVGHAGTAMRFLVALFAFVPGAQVELCGSERMHQRPIADLVEALRSLGARISYLGAEGSAPLKVVGVAAPNLAEVEISGSVSSQFISSLLLVSPLFVKGLCLNLNSELVSKSYVDMTLNMLSRFGLSSQNQNYLKISAVGKVKPSEYVIEPDASGASYFWAAAALAPGRVRVICNSKSLQGDIKFPELLERMGCKVIETEDSIEVVGADNLVGCEADMILMPDTAQTLSVVAAFAKGETVISGLKTLKSKETDRLLALKTELERAGIHATITADSIRIFGGEPKASRFKTYADHRMAMSFALMGVRLRGVEIEDPMVVKKSLPNFWDCFSSLGVKVCELS